MKFKLYLIMSLLVLMCISCMDLRFISTGNSYPELNENLKVKVHLENKEIKGFDEIGYLELNNVSSPLDVVVEKVKNEAKKRGANCVIMVNDLQGFATTPSGYLTSTKNYRFKIGYVKE